MRGGWSLKLIFVYTVQRVAIKVREGSASGREGVQSVGDLTVEVEPVAFSSFTRRSDVDRQARSSLATAVVILGPKRLHPGDSCPAKGEVFCLLFDLGGRVPPPCERPYLGHLGHMGPGQMTRRHSALIPFPFRGRPTRTH